MTGDGLPAGTNQCQAAPPAADAPGPVAWLRSWSWRRGGAVGPEVGRRDGPERLFACCGPSD
jgi:hypothetical protein